jgi:hypothetical protein
MSKELKIYLSYHHDDNVSIDEDRGWVDNFSRLLGMMVNQVYSLDVVFCQAAGNDGYLKTRPGNTDASILILSPNYLEDPLTKEEMKQISSGTGSDRIFKVVKYPIKDYVLNGLTDLTAYTFYTVDRDTGKARTHQDLINPKQEETVWMKIMDLAEAIIGTDHTKQKSLQETVETDPGKTIYLADTGSSLSVERNIIRRELNRFGYNVLPKEAIPSDTSKAKPIITESLKRSKLSIHLIDNKVYIGKDNTHWDLAMIQNQLAMEEFENHTGQFSRLIWIPREDEEDPGISDSEDQLEFTRNAEVLQTSIEDLKNVLKYNLVLQSEDKGEIIEDQNSGNKRAYVIYDQANKNEIDEVIAKIRAEGFDVLLPSFDQDLLAVRDQHISNLKACDLALIYFRSSDNIWLRMKFLDLVKSPGMGRTKGQIQKVIIHEQGQNLDKSFFEKHGTHFHVIGNTYSFLKSITNPDG